LIIEASYTDLYTIIVLPQTLDSNLKLDHNLTSGKTRRYKSSTIKHIDQAR